MIISRDLLDGLTTFLAVAERRSFTGAAAALGVTPQAVSQTVKALERRIGSPLFSRTTRAVALTEAGERLLAQAAPAVDSVAAAIDAAASLGDEPSGLLRINLPHLAAVLIIQPRLAAFCRRFPKIKIELFADDRFADIITDGFDAGIRLGEMVAADMVSTPLTPPERFSVVGSPAYFGRAGRPQQPEDLHNHACFNFRMTRGFYRWEFEKDGRSWELALDGPLIVNGSTLAISAAEDGLGLTYTLDRLVASLIEQGRLERVLEQFCPASPGFYLYYPSRAQVMPKLRAFIDFFRRR